VNTEHRKNRITIILLFAMSIIPFGVAWYLADNPDNVSLGTNNGDLIIPPVTTELNEVSGYDNFSSENIRELQGHWVMINFLADGECPQVCQEALFKTRQISLMMGKDIARIRRLAIVSRKTEQAFPKEWQDDARLLKVYVSDTLREKLSKISGGSEQGMLMIMDPLGNLMMKYSVGYDPYKVRNDLSKLLRISQIG
jgi:hypothetical protein